jgi:hypothetical protein
MDFPDLYYYEFADPDQYYNEFEVGDDDFAVPDDDECLEGDWEGDGDLLASCSDDRGDDNEAASCCSDDWGDDDEAASCSAASADEYEYVFFSLLEGIFSEFVVLGGICG